MNDKKVDSRLSVLPSSNVNESKAINQTSEEKKSLKKHRSFK
jgi:hypothetical protein